MDDPATPGSSAGRKRPAKNTNWKKWVDLVGRALDSGVLSADFGELLRDRLHRWSVLRGDEAKKYRLPILKIKAFPANDIEVWHQTWDEWLAKFELVSRGTQQDAADESEAPAVDEFKLGVALVPVK